MSIEANRDLVLTFCRHLSARRLDQMFALMAGDATWSWVGKVETFKFAGPRTKQQTVELLSMLLGAFSTFRFDVVSTTAEADRVAIEARSQAVGRGGQPYENEYFMMFECRDGLVTRISEFFDQLTVLEFEKSVS